jgi:hypothetical protein
VGGNAQIKAMKQVAGSLKLNLAQYREVEAFAQFGSEDLDKTTKKQLETGKRLFELLKQNEGVPMPVEQQIVVIFAGTAGFLDGLPVEAVGKYEEKLLEFAQQNHPEILREIKEKKNLEREELKDLFEESKNKIENFKKEKDFKKIYNDLKIKIQNRSGNEFDDLFKEFEDKIKDIDTREKEFKDFLYGLEDKIKNFKEEDLENLFKKEIGDKVKNVKEEGFKNLLKELENKIKDTYSKKKEFGDSFKGLENEITNVKAEELKNLFKELEDKIIRNLIHKMKAVLEDFDEEFRRFLEK